MLLFRYLLALSHLNSSCLFTMCIKQHLGPLLLSWSPDGAGFHLRPISVDFAHSALLCFRSDSSVVSWRRDFWLADYYLNFYWEPACWGAMLFMLYSIVVTLASCVRTVQWRRCKQVFGLQRYSTDFCRITAVLLKTFIRLRIRSSDETRQIIKSVVGNVSNL